MAQKASEWKLEGKSYQIADTGDYDGYYELSIGKYKLHSGTEVEDDEWDKLNSIIEELNKIPMYWYDPYEGVDQHIISHQQEQMGAMYQYLREKGLENDYEQWYMTPRPVADTKE